MLRERSKLIVQAHQTLDICLTAAAFIASYFIKRELLPEPFRGLTIAPNYYVVLLIITIIWYVTFPTMAFRTIPPNQSDLLIKSVFDYLFAFAVLILLLPFLLIIAAAIKLSSRGPVLFTQERSGLNGRRFRVYKFRTMFADAEARREQVKDLNESDGPVFKIRKDPRIIPYIGTFLRKTGIDELPQLINVLKGEMSLVGPRPPIPAEVDDYDRWQMRRLSMKPGLTCLWQVSPNRNDLSFDQWMKKDLEYIDNWSLWLDFKIMLMTVRAMLKGEGR